MGVFAARPFSTSIISCGNRKSIQDHSLSGLFILQEGIRVLQKQILKGEIAYMNNLTRRTDVSLEKIATAKESLDNKVKGIKLDQAVEQYARLVHAF